MDELGFHLTLRIGHTWMTAKGESPKILAAKGIEMETSFSTDDHVRKGTVALASLNERRARWGRMLLWALIANVTFTGVIGPYLLPRDIFIYLSTLLGGDYVHQGAVLAQRPWVDVGHRLLGVTLLVAGMLQFDPQLRRGYPKLHRWAGRIFLMLVLVISATALIMGFSYPFSGPPESVFVVTVCMLLLWFSASAWREIRRRNFARHREWMIRTLGLCFFIAVQRLIYISMVVATDWPDREIFLLSNWMGVVIALVAAESWINLTRKPVPLGASA